MSIERLLSHPKLTVVAIIAGIALGLPLIGQGFILDDPMILSAIEEWHPEHTNAFDIYSSLSEELQLPWWASSQTKISFFRVLSSALLRLDHLLFGRWAMGYYLHSLLWLGILLVLVSRLYRRLVPRLAPLALLIFAVDECHGITAGWISNRHAMVAVTFGIAGLLAHLRWREDGWRPGLPISVAGYVLALLSGETGVTVLTYAGAYELVAGPGEGRRRWLGLVPPMLVGAAYVAWYKGMGYGFKGAGFYIDPGSQPIEFLGAAMARIPALLGNALTGLPPDIWWEPSMRPPLVTAGALALLGLGIVLRLGWTSFDEVERRHLRWLIAGAVLSSIPLVAAFPATRQLLAPMLALAVLLAAMFEALRRRWWKATNRWKRTAAAGMAIVLILVHLGAAPVQRIALQRSYAQLHQNILHTMEQIPPEWAPEQGRREVIALNVPDTFTILYGPVLLDFVRGTRRGHWLVLTAAPHDHRLTRTGPQTLELEVLSGEMLATALETGWPPEKKLIPGTVIERDLFQVEVLEVGAVGPTLLRFDFNIPLDDPEILTVRWGDSGFENVTLPRIGESLLLKNTPRAAI